MNALKSLAVAATLVLAAAAPTVLAQPHGKPGMPRDAFPAPHFLMMGMLDDVGASEAQRAQIRSIFKTAREELRGQMQEGRGQQAQLLQLWAQPNIDAAAIDALRKQQLAQQERVSARMQAAFIEAGRVLTPEQRAKVAERSAKRAERMKQRMERHRGEHGGKH